MATIHTVKQSADLLGTSTATVRRIADEFAEILPDYQPAQGKARKFTPADLRTISAIQSRLQASPGTTRAALLAELSAPGSEPLIIPDTLPTPTAQDAPESPKAGKAIQTTSPLPENALQPFLQTQTNIERQIENLSDQLAEIERRESQPAQGERRYPAAVILCFVLLLTGVTFSAILGDSQAALIMSFVALVVIAAALIWPSMRR